MCLTCQLFFSLVSELLATSSGQEQDSSSMTATTAAMQPAVSRDKATATSALHYVEDGAWEGDATIILSFKIRTSIHSIPFQPLVCQRTPTKQYTL